MNNKRITTSIFLATLMLVSLFAVVSSAASVSGTTMAGTGPAVTGTKAGNLDIFAVDPSGTLWNTAIAPSGIGTWKSLGGVWTSSPAATSRNNGGMTVFVRGNDSAVWYRDYVRGFWGTWTWGKWTSIGGQIPAGTGPAACSWGTSRLDVFVQGTDAALWHKSYNGTSWSGWESLGGNLTSSPAATSNTTNNIQVFARGTDGAVWQKTYNNGWSDDWQSLGGQVAAGTGPAVSQDLWVIVQGTDHQLWQKVAGGYEAAWRAPGSPPETLATASPAATLNVEDHTVVVVTTTSGSVWWASHDVAGNLTAGNLTGWSSAGSPS
ncbi:MAG: hypothetical protein WCB79_05220 [Halobacteriota archaeon]